MDDNFEYGIRFRAHELWLQGGEPNATSLAFWFAAEAELGLQAVASPMPGVRPLSGAADLKEKDIASWS